MPVALMHASAASVAAGQVSLYLCEMPLKLAVQWPVLACQDTLHCQYLHVVSLNLTVQWPVLACLDACIVWLPAMGWELPGAGMRGSQHVFR